MYYYSKYPVRMELFITLMNTIKKVGSRRVGDVVERNVLHIYGIGYKQNAKSYRGSMIAFYKHACTC